MYHLLDSARSRETAKIFWTNNVLEKVYPHAPTVQGKVFNIYFYAWYLVSFVGKCVIAVITLTQVLRGFARLRLNVSLTALNYF